MNKTLILLSFLTFALTLPLSSVQASGINKNTYYFLKDDGKFSDEEKDEEAAYIHDRCQSNILQRVYFNCGCVAGAFRLTRDTDEKLRPQSAILNEIYNDKSYQCINKPVIAGANYQFCSDYAQNFRSRSRNNEKYCTCVANTVANEFEDDPRLRTKHIESLRTSALVSCGRKYK